MLVKLLGSNARVKILKIFLIQPDNKYYIRQLARDLKLQVNSVRRELENLEKFGLLYSAMGKEAEEENGEAVKKQSAKQEKKYYQADQNFTLFEEVRNLITKSQVLYEDDFVDKLKKLGKIKYLILTGIFSGAKNAPTDILAVGSVAKDKFVKIIKDLEDELGREVNFTLMSPREFKYRRDITDVFLYNVLESRNIKAIDELS